MCSRTEAPRRGFTLVEGLVTLVILTVVIVGLLTLLDSSSRLAKQETQVADAQGGGRSAIYEITRLVRQGRVGHLSPTNAVMPWVNNAPASTTLGGRTVRQGTDAIEVRGNLFGDSYVVEPADVTCGGVTSTCTGNSNRASVTIRQNVRGYDNFPAGRRPEIADRSRPFYFVVASSDYQFVNGTNSSGSRAQILPLYYVGRVDADVPNWGTYSAGPPASFQFFVDFTDPGARALNATADFSLVLNTPFAASAVDDIVLFVDRGPEDTSTPGTDYNHPFLAQAIFRPNNTANPTVEVERLVDDVEDLQFAYGVDTRNTAGALVPDRGVDPTVLSTTKDGDEWVFNVEGETLAEQAGPRRIESFLVGPNGLLASEASPVATEALRAVFVSVVTKSLDPDLRFTGPGATGVKTFDSTAPPVSTTRPYRRRVQTMAVNLRNYV